MARVADFLERISKHEAWEISKPWLEKAAVSAGVKSIYDVPEYFREKFELKGLKIGNTELGGGLAGATTDLLEKNKETRATNTGGGRREIYNRLTELENQGDTESNEYKALTEKLADTRSTKVKEAIEKVNKKLSLTKEGSEKGSEVRKEMARILREQRKAKTINQETLTKDVNNTLDNYSTQKVDGVTATREALRTALTATGTRQFMGAANVALDGVAFVNKARQKAKQEGEAFDAKNLTREIATNAKQQWQDLKNTMKQTSNTGKVASVGAIASKLGESAAKYGIDTGGTHHLTRLVAPVVAQAKPNFKRVTDPTPQPVAQVNEVPSPSKGLNSVPATKTNSSASAANDDQYDSPQARRQNFHIHESDKDDKKPLPPPKKKEANPEKEVPKDTSVPKSNERITQADRSYLNKPFFEDSSMSGGERETTDEQFSQSYGQTGLQPSYASQDPRIRKVRKEEKKSQQSTIGEAAPAQPGQTQPNPRRQPRGAIVSRKANQRALANKRKIDLKAKKAARLKATAINRTVMMWLIPSYLAIQLPFAVLNTVFLGMAYTVGSLVEAGDDPSAGFFSKLGASIIDGMSKLAAAVTGVDILKIPEQLYMLTVLILLAYMSIILLSLSLLYVSAGLKPFSGQGSSSKTGAFILCLTGYFTPLLNLLPWVVIWAWVVGKNPK